MKGEEYEPTGTSSGIRSQVPHPRPAWAADGGPMDPTGTYPLSFLKGDKILSTIVCIESPFAGRGANRIERWLDARQNLKYARACVRDSLMRGESPFASHLLYTQPGILRDGVWAEREHGIGAGLRFQEVAAMVAVYIDRDITSGMKLAMAQAKRNGKPVLFRSLHETGSTRVVID